MDEQHMRDMMQQLTSLAKDWQRHVSYTEGDYGSGLEAATRSDGEHLEDLLKHFGVPVHMYGKPVIVTLTQEAPNMWVIVWMDQYGKWLGQLVGLTRDQAIDLFSDIKWW